MEALLERELEIARRIQSSFLPEQLPEFPGWEIAARFQPARQVAGDFYDAFPLIQNRRLGLVIGDVCDKGVGAALFMALFRTLIRAFAQQHQSLRWMSGFSDEGPGQAAAGGRPVLPSIGTSALRNAIELTNAYIADVHGSTNMFATLFLGILDPTNGSLQYVNAGHETPLLIKSSGLKEKLTPTGPVVGLFPEARYDIRSVMLEPGDLLLTFTDGVTEAMNSDGEPFGHERLLSLVTQPAPTAADLLDRLHTGVQEYIDTADPSDDITLLAVRRQ